MPRPRSISPLTQTVKLCLSVLLSLSLISLSTGCMNLYTRCPGTKPKISRCYKSTKAMASISYSLAFPQTLDGHDPSFSLDNLITTPFALICYIDTACEAVLDTVFLPFDYFLVRYRHKTFAAPSHYPPYSPLPICDSIP